MLPLFFTVPFMATISHVHHLPTDMSLFTIGLPRIAPTLRIGTRPSYRSALLWGCVLAGLFWQRAYLLTSTPLFDYDSVTNLEIIRQVALGDFGQVFHHSSPTFYLLYAFVYQLFPSYLHLEYFTALLNLVALLATVSLYGKAFGLEASDRPWVLLFVGSAFFQVASSRYLAIESLSLCLFAPLPWLYQRLTDHTDSQQGQQAAWWFGFTWALLLTVNYKALLLVPVFVIFDFAKGHFRRRTLRLWMGIFAPFLLLSLGYTLLGGLSGAGWDNYTKHWLILLIKKVNPHYEVPMLNGDIFFYFQYLADFESLLIWIAFPAFLLHFFWKWPQFNPTARLLVFLVLFTWLLMSILQKAPRGLLFIYPLLYLFSYAGLKYFMKDARLFGGILALSIALNLLNCHLGIYQFAATSYPKMADTVAALNIKALAGTTGKGLVPYLAPSIEYHAVFGQEALEALPLKTSEYLILDEYRTAAGMEAFFSLPEGTSPIVAFREPSLMAPLVWLEMCEFTGLSYQATMAKREKALQKPWHIALINLKGK